MNPCWCVSQVGDHHSHIYVWNLHNNYEVSPAPSQTQTTTTSLVITPPPVFYTGTHFCVVQVQQISVQPGGGALQQGRSAVPEQPATDNRRRERRRV